MMRTILPTMDTESYDIAFGAMQYGLDHQKLTVVLGNPGSGKTSMLENYQAQDPDHIHIITCSPNTTMRSMLVDIANKIGAHVDGDNVKKQQQIIEALQENSSHCILLDECEYLHRGNVSKIDVIRQIYDATGAQFVLCGTYDLQKLIRGTEQANQHQPQICRRLIKAEFPLIRQKEVSDYLDLIEREYAVSFTSEVQKELFTLCIDQENGSLGIFVEMLELLLSVYRPDEWVTISHQYHITHGDYLAEALLTEYRQAHRLNRDEHALDDEEEEPKLPDPEQIIHENENYIDVSSLEKITIDIKKYRDACKYRFT